NSFAFVTGRFYEPRDPGVEGSRNLPLIPAPRWDCEFRGDWKKLSSHIHNGYIKLEISSTFSQNRPFTGYDTETVTKGYSLLHVGCGFDIKGKKATSCSLHLGISNVLNTAYQSHLSRLK